MGVELGLCRSSAGSYVLDFTSDGVTLNTLSSLASLSAYNTSYTADVSFLEHLYKLGLKQ